MTSGRHAFLQRVRRALRADARPGSAPPLPERGQVGYQGAGGDAVERFCLELAAAGGQAHRAADSVDAAARIVELVRGKSARRVLLGRGPFLDPLGLPEQLAPLGIEAAVVDRLDAATCRETFFAADVGISGVDYLIAETGTVVLLARPEEPRSLSLLPPVHIAVADRSQLVPDLFDLFASPVWQERGGPPSCLTLITGPSKTGDIELRLVTGVHGPGEVHVILLGTA
jgi:L-lactate utilization protein LutC